MTAPSLEAFRRSLDDTAPLPSLPPALEALWWAHRGRWEAAHRIVQSESDGDCAWVHAYLHRREGDDSNAGYWYRRAGRQVAAGAFEAEWNAIATALSAGALGRDPKIKRPDL